MVFRLSGGNYKFYPLFIEHWSHYWATALDAITLIPSDFFAPYRRLVPRFFQRSQIIDYPFLEAWRGPGSGSGVKRKWVWAHA